MEKKDIEVFKQAILNEIEGYEFYKMAAHQSEDQSVKETFEMLSQEELKHADWLKDAFKKLSENPEDQSTLAILENPPTAGIFKWENLQSQSANLAVSVLGIGIEMERASIAFYEKAHRETPYQTARSIFEVLIKWEKVHLEQFSRAYDQLKEDWWVDQGFAPF